MAHELTHYIEQWSPEKYKVLADFLIQNYEQGRSMDELVRIKQIALGDGRGKTVSYEEAYSEVIADSMEAMLADGNVMDKLLQLKAQDRSLFRKMKEFFDRMLQKITGYYEGLEPESEEGQAVLAMKGQIAGIQQLFAEALSEAGENYRAAETQKNTAVKDGDVRFCVREGRLTKNSTEAERYNLLKDAAVKVAEIDENAISDVNLEDYNTRKKSAVTPGLKKLADKLRILNVDLENSKLGFGFEFSKKSLEKSLHHQLEYGGTYQDYVKAMSCFKELVENAVPIEIHTKKDRNQKS